MSATTMPTATAEIVSSTAEPPPIATLLPLLQSALAGSSLLLRFALRTLLATAYPLRAIWSVFYALFSPIIIMFQIALDVALFTPLSIIRTVAVELYPVYVFYAIACIFGVAIGVSGNYIATAILNVLARSKYFTRPPSPPPAAPPSSSQAMLRKRRRRSVRVQ